jgi:hypothetical protein
MTLPEPTMVTIGLISLPHWMYAFIWTKSQSWMKITEKVGDPVTVMFNAAQALKCIQAAAFVWWYTSVAAPRPLADILSLDARFFIGGVAGTSFRGCLWLLLFSFCYFVVCCFLLLLRYVGATSRD